MKNLITIVLILFSGVLLAQDIAFKKSNFKDDKDGYKVAVDNIESGDEFLELGNQKVLQMIFAGEEFTKALEFYQMAYDFNPNSSLLNQKMGNAYIYTNKPYKAKPFLDKSLELNNDDAQAFLYFLLGKAHQLDREFDIAKDYFLKYGSLAVDKELEIYKKLNRKHIQECDSGAEIFAVERRVWVDNVKSLNSEMDDISPCINADGSEIIISTDRAGNMDIYKSVKQKRKWVGVNPIRELNSSVDDIATGLAYDGQRILLFKDIEGQTDIFESKLNGTKWTEPKIKMSKIVNTEFNETFACYDPQDIKVYYVTDGGYGGDKNIFFSGKKDD